MARRRVGQRARLAVLWITLLAATSCLALLSVREARAQFQQGIDVSSWQGPSIAWPTVGTSGISFAYIRAGEGSSQPDDDFQKNWTGAKAAGITVGAYLFFHPSQDPVAQAGLLVHQLQLVAFI